MDQKKKVHCIPGAVEFAAYLGIRSCKELCFSMTMSKFDFTSYFKKKDDLKMKPHAFLKLSLQSQVLMLAG